MVSKSTHLGMTELAGDVVTGGETIFLTELEAASNLDTASGRDAASLRSGFGGSAAASVGLEEELIVVDPDSLEPVLDAEALLSIATDSRITRELRTSQLELVLPPSSRVGRLSRVLGHSRLRLADALGDRAKLLAAGGHPRSCEPNRITDSPRYREIERDYAWGTRRGLPTGLHVHVDAGEADEALALYNACRTFLPELAALAANSPFFEGADSGLASSRLKLTEDFPRSGIPPLFDTWEDIAGFATWGAAGGLFPDMTYCWWDLRLRPEYGTLEFRVADTQTTLDETAAVVAVCQSLVAALSERYRAGERLPSHPSHVINENRWRAVRDGLDGELVDCDTGARQPARERLTRLLLQLEPYAASLGCGDELAHAWPMIAQNGATRQRALARRQGLDAVVEALIVRTGPPGKPRSARDVAEVGRRP